MRWGSSCAGHGETRGKGPAGGWVAQVGREPHMACVRCSWTARDPRREARQLWAVGARCQTGSEPPTIRNTGSVPRGPPGRNVKACRRAPSTSARGKGIGQERRQLEGTTMSLRSGPGKGWGWGHCRQSQEMTKRGQPGLCRIRTQKILTRSECQHETHLCADCEHVAPTSHKMQRSVCQILVRGGV